MSIDFTDTRSEDRGRLPRLAHGFDCPDEYSNDELLRLGIGYGIPGALSV